MVIINNLFSHWTSFKMAGPHPKLSDENLEWYPEICAVILLGDPNVCYSLRNTDVTCDCKNIPVLD